MATNTSNTELTDYEMAVNILKVFATASGVLLTMAGASWLTKSHQSDKQGKDKVTVKDASHKSSEEAAAEASSSPSTTKTTSKASANDKRQNFHLLYKSKKYRFMDRPSLLDTGMSMILPWRQDESDGTHPFKKSIFRGWFNLLWLITISFVCSQFYENYLKHGTFFSNFRFFNGLKSYFHELLLIILPVYLFSFSAFFLQKLMAYEIFGVKYTRSILSFIQHVIQSTLIFGVGGFVYFFCEHWPFSQKLALTMQTITFYMKMHSYLLSNDELYELKKETLNNKNIKRSQMSDVNKMDNSKIIDELRKRGIRNLDNLPNKSNFFCFFATMDDNIDNNNNSDDSESSNEINLLHRNSANLCLSARSIKPFEYPSTKEKISRMLNDEGLEISEAIDSLKKLEENEERMDYYRMVLKDAIFMENYRCDIYPKNVTFWNFFEFTWMPTVVYEPLYPRTSGIRIFYLLEKALSLVLLIGVMYTLFEKFMFPVLVDTSMNSVEQIIKLLVPMTILDILGFFLVFDVILNFFAEMTCFADREFYQDWWNSTMYEEFSRKWNVPVHSFLLRHIYYKSMGDYKFDRKWATAGTFVFSIVFHEIILSACMHRFRPWLAIMSLFQLPLMPIMQSPVFKDKPLGNLFFWFGLILGIPMVSVLYAREYCADVRFCYN